MLGKFYTQSLVSQTFSTIIAFLFLLHEEESDHAS